MGSSEPSRTSHCRPPKSSSPPLYQDQPRPSQHPGALSSLLRAVCTTCLATLEPIDRTTSSLGLMQFLLLNPWPEESFLHRLPSLGSRPPDPASPITWRKLYMHKCLRTHLWPTKPFPLPSWQVSIQRCLQIRQKLPLMLLRAASRIENPVPTTKVLADRKLHRMPGP